MNVSDRFRNGRFYFFDEGSKVMKHDNRVILLSIHNKLQGGGGCEVPETSIVNVNTAIFLYKFQYAPNKNKKKKSGGGDFPSKIIFV